MTATQAEGRHYSFGPAAILARAGVFTALPKAFARMTGAAAMARVMVDRTPAPVAPSPATIVGAEGAARLLRYDRDPAAPVKEPILLCPSVINRLYVLDLKAGISVVEQLKKAGHPVYGIDWGDPGVDEEGVNFEGFVARLGRLLENACIDAGVQRMHLLGHCLGGTMATALAATDDSRIASLINLTAPVAFHDGGLLSKWTRAPFFDAALVTRALGHVPPWLTQPSFQILKPLAQPVKALRLFQTLDKVASDPQFLDFFRCLETWINDNVAIPDAFFVDLIEKLYKKDALIKGELCFSTGPVLLEEITVPVLTIAASEDHIVPPRSAVAAQELLGSKVKHAEVLPGGHIGVLVGGLARRRLWPMLLSWLEERSLPQTTRPRSVREPS